MSANDFQFFDDLVETALRRRVERVEIVGQSGEVEAPFRWKIAVPSLALCLGGVGSLCFVQGGITREREQTAGQGFVMVPGCWLGTRPNQAHESLQIRFRPNATLFLHQHFEGDAATLAGFPANIVKRRLVSPVRLDPAGHELFRLLLSPPALAQPEFRRALFEALLCQARQTLGDEPASTKAAQTYLSARRFIEAHCAEPLSRESVARALRLHPNYLSQLFARQSSESFGEFLLRVRLERARHLLRTPGLNVAEVARLAGFADANYFIRAFKKRYAITPGRARQSPDFSNDF